MATGADPQTDYKNRSSTVALNATQTEIDPDLSDRYRKPRTGAAQTVGGWGRLVCQNRREFERFWDEQGLLWCAFSFAAGIGVYFALPSEPSLMALLGISVCMSLLTLLVGRRLAFNRRSVLGVALVLGVITGSVHGRMAEAPRLAEPFNAEITGRILELQSRPASKRLVLAVETVNQRVLKPTEFPRKIRLRVPKDSPGAVGDLVRVRGRFFPPPGPVHPGGYDYSFRAYFSQTGATGFAFGPAVLLDGATDQPGLRFAALIAGARTGLTDHIRTVLGERPEAALIIAVLVGDRGGITEAQEEALRASGLAHILAISGLHMALFAGGTYGAMLMLLALFPVLTLRWPTQKWAALAALFAATVYLFLSGGSVATQRSFLMIALVFLGLLVGRRGLTLRSVALAALVLLALSPERLFHPGFQMSFAAVICLVGVYDLWRRRDVGLRTHSHNQPLARKILHSIGRWGIGLFVTAVVAGLATGIIGAHHFGRIAPFGLVGNMLGMPVFTLMVMPMGVLSLALMPFGLASLPLEVMSFGVSLLLEIASFTASLDAGQGTVGKLNALATLLFTAALFVVLLLPGRLRFAAVFLFVGGLVSTMQSRPPDVQISAAGSRSAARDEAGQLRYSGRANSFQTELWYQTEGISSNAIKAYKMSSPQRRCDAYGCVVHAYGADDTSWQSAERLPVRIAFPKTPEAFLADCRLADIVVSDLIAPKDCAAGHVFDQVIRKERGAIAIWLSGSTPVEDPSHHRVPGTGTDTSRRPGIARVQFAIPDPPRPWHRPGAVTYDSLRSAIGKSR